MKLTGEQLIPELSKKRLIDEHLDRYKFSLDYVKNKKVLDISYLGSPLMKYFSKDNDVLGLI